MFPFSRRRSKQQPKPQNKPAQRFGTFELLEGRAMLTTYSVVNLHDSGSGSLRQAILDANNNAGADTIDFQTSGTISLTSGALPTIIDTVDIDGTTAPGYLEPPVVEIDFNQFNGLEFDSDASGSTLRALSLVDSGADAVTLNNVTDMVLAGDYLGITTGGDHVGNTGNGLVLLGSDANTIGGTDILDRNVISYNHLNGISISNSSNNVILGNYIGTDVTGEYDLGNFANGVVISGGASNTVGGDLGNLISGNNADGVFLADNTSVNTISGNQIGVDALGATALGNGVDGIRLLNASNNIIGKTDPGTGISYYNADNVTLNGQPVDAWQGIRGGDSPDEYIITGTSGDDGLLYIGSIDGTSGTTYAVDYAGSLNTSVYGPNNLGGGNLQLVGSYKNSDFQTAQVTVNGFLFQGTTADLNDSNAYTQLDYPDSMFNYVHSTAGGLVVGNYDSAVQHGAYGLPAGPGHAFIYDIASGLYVKEIVYPGSLSNTAYGIWSNGGTSYTIVGGYSLDAVNNFDDQNRPIGSAYMVDYDSSTGLFSNWTTFNDPRGTDYLTHFEGISSVTPSIYTLSADSVQTGTNDPAQGSFVTVHRNADGTFGPATWTNLNYPGFDPSTSEVSSNSVYGNQVVGVVFNGEDPFSYQATVTDAFEWSNVVSGNGANGIELTNADNNTIGMNYVGTDITGSVAIGNALDGITLTNSNNNTIGNTDAVRDISYENSDNISLNGEGVSGWQGIRAADTPGNYLITGTSGDNGLLYIGTMDGHGTSYAVNYGSLNTSVYGPNNLGGGNLQLVGSAKNTDYQTAPVTVNGFLFQGTTADLTDSNAYTQIDYPDAQYNYVHSTAGGLVVGNYDSAVQHGQFSLPFGPGHAFIYDIATGLFIKEIVFPGSMSNSVYGIWSNGGTSYTLVGGYSNLPVANFDDQSRPIGTAYMVDYDSATGLFTHWTSFSDPSGFDLLTHFQGISSVEKGVYTLAAASAQAGTGTPVQGSFVTVVRNADGSFGPATWTPLAMTGFDPSTSPTFADAVYGNQVVGIVLDGGAIPYQATVNLAFQLSNVISGNGRNGIQLTGSDNNQMAMNYVGTDYTGTLDLGNASNGIAINGASANNLVGGEATGGNDPTNGVFVRPPQGNLISANGGNGVLITGGATGNQLSGNFIGTTDSGVAPLGNSLDGVAIDAADGNILLGCTFQQDPFVFYNVIGANGGNGLRVTNSDDTTIQANFFGLGADNRTPVGNLQDGVLVEGDSKRTTMGGPIPLGNVDAANGFNGIEVRDTASSFISYNTFTGEAAFSPNPLLGNHRNGMLFTSTGGDILLRTNVIGENWNDGVLVSGDATGVDIVGDINGTNYNGTAAMGNHNNGVEVAGNAHDISIGGPQPAFNIVPQNTISGNANNGVEIDGTAHNVVVNHSYIGTDVFGATAIANGNAGVLINVGAYSNTIGSLDSSLATLISGNTTTGIEMHGTHDNTVIGTKIGTDASGVLPVANGGNGIYIDTSNNNTIGGTAPGAGNTIAFNTYNGVIVWSGTGNAIERNSIHGNSQLGIYLGVGANDNQAAPVLSPALLTTHLTISGTLTSTPNTTFTVEFFANDTHEPQGKNYLGSRTVTTNSQGVATFTYIGPLPPAGSHFYTATATSPTNDTSEFSNIVGSVV